MKVTRENYAKFVSKAIPLLTLAYFLQAYFYLEYAPEAVAKEVVGCLGLSLVGLFIYYFVYDRYHTVVFHPTYMEIRFDPLQIHQECLYREIMDVQIKDGKKSYHHVMIHLKSGDVLKLAYVDNAHTIRKYLLERA
ncbi:MAG: hypothetical protein H0V66_01830 [Bdellovibrionales bacterium]|nr:hypothetical protein [Bdellovibrionales bacterium]